MAASAWTIYNEAKKYLVDGTIDLNTDTIVVRLARGSSNASTFTLSTLAQITLSVTGGYTGDKTLGNVALTAGASAKQIKFDASDIIFTASGAALSAVQYAVIGESGGKVIAWSKLSTAPFTVTSGNTLTIQFNASGIFTLT